MKLRHKKPLNPYKGQTNNDKNEFNDDDFRQQTSPPNKNGGNPTDQIHKYARILSKFAKTINQDYRYLKSRQQSIQRPPSSERPLSKVKQQMVPQGEALFTKKQQLRQLKQMSKLQNKIEPKDDRKQSAPPTKKRDYQQTSTTGRQPRTLAQNFFSGGQIPQNAPQSLGKTQQQSKIKEYFKNPNQKNGQNNPNTHLLGASTAITSKGNAPTPQNHLPPPGNQPRPNASMPPHYQNTMNTPGLPPNFPAMMSSNQMLAGLNMLGMNNLQGYNPAQITQLLMRNYNQNLIYGGVPVGMNMNNLNMAMMGLGLQNTPNNQRFVLPLDVKINLFSQQVKAFITIQQNSPKDLKAAYPLKRSAFHVAISYKIYLDKLKQEGHAIESLDDIDPTRNARRIKNNQQPKNAKEASKKKK